MTRSPRPVLLAALLLLLPPAPAAAFSGDLFDIGLGGACPGGLIEWLVNT